MMTMLSWAALISITVGGIASLVFTKKYITDYKPSFFTYTTISMLFMFAGVMYMFFSDQVYILIQNVLNVDEIWSVFFAFFIFSPVYGIMHGVDSKTDFPFYFKVRKKYFRIFVQQIICFLTIIIPLVYNICKICGYGLDPIDAVVFMVAVVVEMLITGFVSDVVDEEI